MRDYKRKFGKAVSLFALSALLLGNTVGFTTPQSAFRFDTSKEAATGTSEDDGSQTPLSNYMTGKDTDVVLSGVNAPAAKYNTGTTIGFTAAVKGTGAYIISIAPVVSSDFPFETNDAAYKIITPNGDEKPASLNASYNFTVRSDVATGYHSVQFLVEYNKDGTNYSIVKNINVKLEGEPEATEAPATEAPAESGPVSTPRVIVTGYETDPVKVNAGDDFTLTLHLQNTSNKTAVSNMKVSMGAANGEFLPTSGSSTQFISKLASGGTTDIVLEMTALASLEPKPYVLTVTCDYEDSSANPFQSVENISIPVYQESRIKITEVMVSPDTISVNNQGSVSFNINNLGKSTLTNVQAKIEGATIESDETFVGNIASGATGYADVTITGISETTDDGTVKLILTYEDSSGEECTYEEDVYVYVMEETFMDEMYEEPVFEEESVGMKPFVKLLIVFGIILVIAAIVVVIIIVNIKKKKRKALEEAEELDEELDEDLLFDESKEKKE